MINIAVDIVSDIMCPWCYIGKRRYQQALTQLDDIAVKTNWRPFQLDPTLPQLGRDRQEYLETKFGGADKAKAIYSRIEQAGSEDGIKFRFSAIKVAPNTLDAHRIIHWSANEGRDVQDKLVERLFELFFLEGENIGDPAILVDAAHFVGMDADIVADLLKTDQDKDAILQEIATAQQMGVTGVPFFIIDNKYAVSGAQPPDQIALVIKQAAQMKAVGAPSA